MKTRNWCSGKMSAAALVLLVLSPVLLHAADETATRSEKKPIGWMRLHAAGAPLRPIYAEDIKAEIVDITHVVDRITTQVEQFPLDPDAPEGQIRRLFEDALPLAKHRADLNEVRDRLSMCMAATQMKAQEARDAGEFSPAEEGAVNECLAHCEKVMAQLNRVHHNTAMLSSATRRTYILNAWKEHQKMMADLREMTSKCPMMMERAMQGIAHETPSDSHPEGHDTH
ncbi:hypothetical protein KQH29_00185 [bacterium]|nr:hypothetical protein [bacterium]